MAVSKAGRKAPESRKGTGKRRAASGSSGKTPVGNQATVQLLQDGAGPDELAVEHASRLGNQAAGAVVAQRSVDVESESEAPPQPVLRLGSKGAAVRQLQLSLNEAGAHPKLQADGDFGKNTVAAVRSFQEARGLKPDGIVGPHTWSALSTAPVAAFSPPDLTKNNLNTTGAVSAETPEEESRITFKLGLKAYHAGDFESALAYFRRSYVLPDLPLDVRYSALTDMAISSERLGATKQAVEYYEEALLFPGAPESDRPRLLEALRRLRSGEELKPGQPSDAPEPTPEERAAADEAGDLEIQRGTAAATAKDAPTAMQHFMAAYSSRNAGTRVRSHGAYLVGATHQEMGNFGQALDFYQETLAFPALSDSLKAQVVERMRQARLGQRATAPDDSEQLSLADQQRVYKEGRDALDAGRYQDAVDSWMRVYGTIAATTEVRRVITFDMGVAHQRMQHFDQAVSLFEEAMVHPGADESFRKQAVERIRQCRNGEMSFQVHGDVGLAAPGPPGNEQLLFTSEVYFATSGSKLTASGSEALRTLVARVTEHSRSHPGNFRILAVGRSSSRWGNETEERSDELNRQLSRERADAVADKLAGLLPPEVVATIQREAAGDDQSEAMGLPSNDNWWAERAVGVAVFFTGAGP